MADLEHNIEVNLRGDLSRRTRSNEQDIKRFSRNSSAYLRRLQRQTKSTGRGLSTLGKGLIAGAGIGGALGIAKISKDLLQAEERFERLGIAVGRPKSEMLDLKREIIAIGNEIDISVDPIQILDAISEIVEKTGDLEFAKANIKNLALAIQAAGAEGASIGALVANFKKLKISSEVDVRSALDILINQGKAGAFTLKNLAELGERNVAAYASMGRTGLPAIRELGAALQLIRQSTGSSEQATSAFESLLATFADADKIKILKEKGGLTIFDPIELKKGKEVLRPINDLILEIVKASGGKKTSLSEVFGEQAIRALNAGVVEFQQTGAIESLKSFYSVNGDGVTILTDATRAANILSQQLGVLARRSGDIFQQQLERNGKLNEFVRKSNQNISDLERVSQEAGRGRINPALPTGDNIGLIDSPIFILKSIFEGLRRQNSLQAKGVLDVSITTEPGIVAKVNRAEFESKSANVSTGPNPVGKD